MEYGKRWALGSHFSIEPQAQLTYHYLWGDDYQTKKGFMAEQGNVDSLVARVAPSPPLIGIVVRTMLDASMQKPRCSMTS